MTFAGWIDADWGVSRLANPLDRVSEDSDSSESDAGRDHEIERGEVDESQEGEMATTPPNQKTLTKHMTLLT